MKTRTRLAAAFSLLMLGCPTSTEISGAVAPSESVTIGACEHQALDQIELRAAGDGSFRIRVQSTPGACFMLHTGSDSVRLTDLTSKRIELGELVKWFDFEAHPTRETVISFDTHPLPSWRSSEKHLLRWQLDSRLIEPSGIIRASNDAGTAWVQAVSGSSVVLDPRVSSTPFTWRLSLRAQLRLEHATASVALERTSQAFPGADLLSPVEAECGLSPRCGDRTFSLPSRSLEAAILEFEDEGTVSVSVSHGDGQFSAIGVETNSEPGTSHRWVDLGTEKPVTAVRLGLDAQRVRSLRLVPR